MSFVTNEFKKALSAIMEGFDPMDLMTEEQLAELAESFEAKLAAVRAKLDAKKKPKGDYDFEPEAPKAAKTKVSGTYGKSFTDMDDEGQERVAVKAAEAPKRGRGRPRKNV
jgi:hypothetical protein